MLLGAKLTREPKPDTLTHHCKILCQCVYGEWRRKSENHRLTAPSFSLVAIQTHGTQCWPCIMHSLNTGLTVALPQQIFSFVSPNSRLGLIGCPLSVTSPVSSGLKGGFAMQSKKQVWRRSISVVRTKWTLHLYIAFSEPHITSGVGLGSNHLQTTISSSMKGTPGAPTITPRFHLVCATWVS